MKYIIEIEDEPFGRNDNSAIPHGMDELYRAKGFNSLVFDKNGFNKLTPLDKELEEAYLQGKHDAEQDLARAAYDEAYQKGLKEGKTRNENGCVGCKYENERIDRSPCIYCCNAFFNQWIAKEKPDEIKVGDEVTYTFIDGAEIPPFVVFAIKDNGENRRYYEGYRRTDGKWVGGGLDYKKTGRHFPQVAELIKAMKEGAE